MIPRMPLDLEKVRRLRQERGWTQEEAALACGVGTGRAVWADIESGRKANLTIDRLEKIAKGLGVRPCDLLK